MAAATTSLPETPGGVRNWDYRYTWIRDTAATLAVLYALGLDWEANDYFHFVADVAAADGGDLQTQTMWGSSRRSRPSMLTNVALETNGLAAVPALGLLVSARVDDAMESGATRA